MKRLVCALAALGSLTALAGCAGPGPGPGPRPYYPYGYAGPSMRYDDYYGYGGGSYGGAWLRPAPRPVGRPGMGPGGRPGGNGGGWSRPGGGR
ncbi:hypothetical protein, partial [Acetobacter okinawensis]